MPRNNLAKIPAELKGQLLARSAAGESYQAIALWLQDQHGIEVTRQGVGAIILNARKGRTEAAIDLYRERLAPGVFDDLDMLDEIIARELQDYREADTVRTRHACAKLLMTAADMRARFMGLDKGKTETKADVESEVLERLEALIQAAGPEVDHPLLPPAEE